MSNLLLTWDSPRRPKVLSYLPLWVQNSLRELILPTSLHDALSWSAFRFPTETARSSRSACRTCEYTLLCPWPARIRCVCKTSTRLTSSGEGALRQSLYARREPVYWYEISDLMLSLLTCC